VGVAFVVVVPVVFGVDFRVVCGLAGFVGGLGGRMRLMVPTWSSGVMTLSAIVPIAVGGLMSLLAIGKDNFVSQLPFVSISFAGVTFVCFVFSPRRGNE
jgi:hypothetical protein